MAIIEANIMILSENEHSEELVVVTIAESKPS